MAYNRRLCSTLLVAILQMIILNSGSKNNAVIFADGKSLSFASPFNTKLDETRLKDIKKLKNKVNRKRKKDNNMRKNSKPSKPHIIQILVDDWGWNNWGIHAKENSNAAEIQTPTLDALAKKGVILDRFYAAPICGPSRSALVTGRNVVHVNTINDPIGAYNLDDRKGGYSGSSPFFTGFPSKLKQGGYKTHLAGKWHAGLATPEQTPQGMGYDSSFGYLSGANDYWTYTIAGEGYCAYFGADIDLIPRVDFWDTDKPLAESLRPDPRCSQDNYLKYRCAFEDDVIADKAIEIIYNHYLNEDEDTPLLLSYHPHSIHSPVFQLPYGWNEKFAWIPDINRRQYAAKVNYIDFKISQVIHALKLTGIYQNAVIVVSSDNGGPVYGNVLSSPGNSQPYPPGINLKENELVGGANNYPLRGGKRSVLEGGVRANAFVTGGMIPKDRRGETLTGYVSMEDWYTTFCALAGVSAVDTEAENEGLPPVDGINQWDYISGKTNTPPRSEIILGGTTSGSIREGDTACVSILDNEGYKIIAVTQAQSFFQGPKYPNKTSDFVYNDNLALNCGNQAVSPYTGACVFNIFEDPGETTNIADTISPTKLNELKTRLDNCQADVYSPDRGVPEEQTCVTSDEFYAGAVGPMFSEPGVLKT